MKSDGESANRKLAETVAKHYGGEVIPEMPAKGESQSNGAVEEAGKTVREFTRVLWMQTGDKAGIKLEADDVITLWMIRWAAVIPSRYKIGKDGPTAHERRRGGGARSQSFPLVSVYGKKVAGATPEESNV